MLLTGWNVPSILSSKQYNGQTVNTYYQKGVVLADGYGDPKISMMSIKKSFSNSELFFVSDKLKDRKNSENNRLDENLTPVLQTKPMIAIVLIKCALVLHNLGSVFKTTGTRMIESVCLMNQTNKS
jgi:hypothetical protein